MENMRISIVICYLKLNVLEFSLKINENYKNFPVQWMKKKSNFSLKY